MGNEKIKGAIYGFAYGDSWGKDPEFKNHPTILAEYPEFPQYAVVTDDTQMSLYAMYAIMFEAENDLAALQGLQLSETKRAKIRTYFADSFLEFAHDPDNDRAPGLTCMNALRSYEHQKRRTVKEKMDGSEGVSPDSKGCGANMRVGWFGLLPLAEEDIINLAIIQSETTHGHPLALSSSVLTALTVKAIYEGEINSGSNTYVAWMEQKTRELLDDLLLRTTDAPGSWSASYRAGLSELLHFIDLIKPSIPAFQSSSASQDICEFFGGGWVAEEALLLGLIAADTLSANPVEAVRRLVYSSGDSDSIAAFGAMFLGAEFGVDAFPAEWKERLEPRYADELEEVDHFLERIQR